MTELLIVCIMHVCYACIIAIIVRHHGREIKQMRKRENDLLDRLFARNNEEYHRFKKVNEVTAKTPKTTNVIKDKYLKNTSREG